MHISRLSQIRPEVSESMRIMIKAEQIRTLSHETHRYIPEMEHYANKTRNILQKPIRRTQPLGRTMTCEMEYRDNCG